MSRETLRRLFSLSFFFFSKRMQLVDQFEDNQNRLLSGKKKKAGRTALSADLSWYKRCFRQDRSWFHSTSMNRTNPTRVILSIRHRPIRCVR